MALTRLSGFLFLFIAGGSVAGLSVTVTVTVRFVAGVCRRKSKMRTRFVPSPLLFAPFSMNISSGYLSRRRRRRREVLSKGVERRKGREV